MGARTFQIEIVDFNSKMDVDDGAMQGEEKVGAAGSDNQAEETHDYLKTPRESDELEESDAIKFSPPVYIQRYCKVYNVLESKLESPKYKGMQASTGKTIMEVGCAEFGMMKHLKHLLDVTKIIFVDLDKELLEEKIYNLKPLPAEYLQKITRRHPLVVEAYAGCVTKVDTTLYQQNPEVFAVIGIEIIEHLHPDILRGFEETVFGITKPQLVVVTTPNAEFNTVFNLQPGQFRHWDHKFEWTRTEFKQWCDKIILEFPMYSYTTEGICEGPVGTNHLGCVSQMAIFERKESFIKNNRGTFIPVPGGSPYASRIQSGAYTLIHSLEYPNFIEKRTPEEITVHEFEYHLCTYLLNKTAVNDYDDAGVTELKIPLAQIQELSGVPRNVAENILQLKIILEGAGYKIGEDSGAFSVIIDIPTYADATFGNCSSSGNSALTEEDMLCEDVKDINVSREIPPPLDWEEDWE